MTRRQQSTSSVAIVLLAVALCACASEDRRTRSSDTAGKSQRVLTCQGRYKASGYPGGRDADKPGVLRILLVPDPAAIRFAMQTMPTLAYVDGKRVPRELPQSPVCITAATKFDRCDASRKNQAIHVVGMHQMISTTLDLNTSTGAVGLGAGGIDGGWYFTGRCVDEAGK
jgi:hypothetical protein